MFTLVKRSKTVISGIIMAIYRARAEGKTSTRVKEAVLSDSAFDDFLKRLDLPEATCEQVHPTVEQFMEEIDPENPDWSGNFSDWMDQANSCLMNELMETLGDPPADPDEAQSYLWTTIRISWLFYRKFHDGAPFDS